MCCFWLVSYHVLESTSGISLSYQYRVNNARAAACQTFHWHICTDHLLQHQREQHAQHVHEQHPLRMLSSIIRGRLIEVHAVVHKNLALTHMLYWQRMWSDFESNTVRVNANAVTRGHCGPVSSPVQTAASHLWQGQDCCTRSTGCPGPAASSLCMHHTQPVT